MSSNVHRERSQVSEQNSEDQELSSVAEMQALVHEAADHTAPSSNWKDRVHAAARCFGLDWGRAKAFYYQDARRVDAKEMDDARRAIRKLRAAAQQRAATEHLAWLRSTVELHRESGEGMDSGTLDAIERFIGRIGDEDSAVVGVAAEDEDQSIGWGE